MEERIFTLAEARSLLPSLKRIIEELSVEWRKASTLNPEIQKVRDRIPMDAFSPYGVEYVKCVTQLVFLLNQIKEMGVVVKDVGKGLCDFPYMRGGKVVYLCWHLGEESIGFWHEIEAGFSGREPLDNSDETQS